MLDQEQQLHKKCPPVDFNGYDLFDPVSESRYELQTPALCSKKAPGVAEGPTIIIDAFVRRLPPPAEDVVRKVQPSALVNQMLPTGLVKEGARYVAACFWAFICVLDSEGTSYPENVDVLNFYRLC